MIRIETWTFGDCVIPPLMRCESDDARAVERMLIMNMINQEIFGDDTLVPDKLEYRSQSWFTPFGLEVKREETGGLGHKFVPQISDLEDDFHKLGKSSFGVDRESAARSREMLEELFGDIMPVVPARFSLYAVPTQDIVHIMEMEDMFVSMYDYPELFDRMLGSLVDDYIEYFELMERECLLLNGVSGEHLAQGSYCFTNELKPTEGASKLSDMWLYMDSQETSGVSPEMYKRFIAPHYARLMRRAGLVSYGCCEAVDGIWQGCLESIENIRKVSISPWCDEEKMGEALSNRRAVYLRKPNPVLLGVSDTLDEDAVRAHYRRTKECAKNCKLEVVQRDVYRVRDAAHVKRYIELARKELGAY